MRIFAVLTMAMLPSFSCLAQAVVPIAVIFSETQVSQSGEEYARYLVQCSDGRRHTITAWQERTLWCADAERNLNCSQVQVKVAHNACQSNSS